MDRVTDAIHLLTAEIISTIRPIYSEEAAPGADADRSDESLRDLRKRLVALKTTRKTLENL